MEPHRHYYRRGFEMRKDIQHLLDRDYRSEAVDRVRENGNELSVDGLTIRLADEFGFCYGVPRSRSRTSTPCWGGGSPWT